MKEIIKEIISKINMFEIIIGIIETLIGIILVKTETNNFAVMILLGGMHIGKGLYGGKEK